ncbi:hypothetical protein K431DRAFT_314256 [Polychaeton citri CBS 116435]|uniref:SMODS and SLOG-associating 2TM effector domain-containing protein n=1 Tax=Polychaeton citri CBS 116435 TaxID=1314669 RepID=A0A9P4Q4A4_9PEZI|nr:hypothetical protein K431DRAFT_314256 [Polychaeton citri CBS 116435]
MVDNSPDNDPSSHYTEGDESTPSTTAATDGGAAGSLSQSQQQPPNTTTTTVETIKTVETVTTSQVPEALQALRAPQAPETRKTTLASSTRETTTVAADRPKYLNEDLLNKLTGLTMDHHHRLYINLQDSIQAADLKYRSINGTTNILLTVQILLSATTLILSTLNVKSKIAISVLAGLSIVVNGSLTTLKRGWSVEKRSKKVKELESIKYELFEIEVQVLAGAKVPCEDILVLWEKYRKAERGDDGKDGGKKATDEEEGKPANETQQSMALQTNNKQGEPTGAEKDALKTSPKETEQTNCCVWSRISWLKHPFTNFTALFG